MVRKGNNRPGKERIEEHPVGGFSSISPVNRIIADRLLFNSKPEILTLKIKDLTPEKNGR